MHYRWLRRLNFDRADRWRRFASTLAKKRKGPVLYFLHILLPHGPFQFLPSGHQEAANNHLPGAGEVWQNQDEVLSEYYRHLLQLRFVDQLLGELLRRKKRAGLYDSALLLLVADHGISFRLGESPRLVTPANSSDVLSVPFFLKRSFQRSGEIVEREVQLIDVLPTILDILDIPESWQVDGRSVLAESPAERGKNRVLASSKNGLSSPSILRPSTTLSDKSWTGLVAAPMNREFSIPG